jgi:hypothetical protein
LALVSPIFALYVAGDGAMNKVTNLTERLASYAEILSLIDTRRRLTGSPMLGSSIEKFILESQFSELGLTA